MWRSLKYLWASPVSLFGLSIGAITLVCGGQARCRDGVLGFSGKTIEWLFDRIPITPMAMTLGHVVLGRTPAALDLTHLHEMVHVRQYECWGPFFIPAYLGSSLWLLLNRQDPYRENPFEKQAFRLVPHVSGSTGKDSGNIP